MMGDTYSRINAAADKQWHLERARIIFSMENEMAYQDRVAEENKCTSPCVPGCVLG